MGVGTGLVQSRVKITQDLCEICIYNISTYRNLKQLLIISKAYNLIYGFFIKIKRGNAFEPKKQLRNLDYNLT